MTDEFEVLVVGAGPVGMTVAGDLARAGRSVGVLERWPGVNPASRAFATMPRTLEVLAARGLADELLAVASPAPEVRLFGDATLDLTHLPSAYRFVAVTPQTNVDRVLTDDAEREGATIVRGVEVVDLAQDGSGVRVTTRPHGDESGEHQVWRAAYVVGADGAHSTVRDLVGLDFPGRTVLSSMVLADVRLTDGPRGGGLTVGATPQTFGFLAPYARRDERGGAWYRAMTWDRRHQVDDTEPIDVDREVVGGLREALAHDYGVAEVGWHSRFHCDERQVRRYRVGRVFLAGDAAHVHSPMGGLGMNTGIQDAANLSWKLDAVLGGGDPALLDTYDAERRPIGRRVVRQSGLMLRAVTLHPAPARFLRDHLAPYLLRRAWFRDRFAGSFAGTGLRYAAPRGASRLVGTRAPGSPVAGPVLLREPGTPPLAELALAQDERADDGPALLVRPDGYVGWAGSLRTERGRRDCLAVLAGWGPVGERAPAVP